MFPVAVKTQYHTSETTTVTQVIWLKRLQYLQVPKTTVTDWNLGDNR